MIYVSEMDGKKSETKETKGCGCGFGVTMPELSGGRGVHGKEWPGLMRYMDGDVL